MDGEGVAVAIVDNGINADFLRQRGLSPKLDVYLSWSPLRTVRPGHAPVDHGSMCAFDAAIAAPDATLLDFAVLQSTRRGGSAMDGILSDAVQAYGVLLTMMMLGDDQRPFHSLVVSNSWGMYSPTWDFPAGHPGRYADNPNHPFNIVVGSLAQAGADILFAAGNCGPGCPDYRCQGHVVNAISGANSHPDVITVAGVDTTGRVAGYSSVGPGALTHDKPDIAAYTHFLGSEAFGWGQPDSGTSAACPVMAGVVAALRTSVHYDRGKANRSPAALKAFLLQHAVRRSAGEAAGWSPIDGYGIVTTAQFDQAPSALT
jgi:subtilase family protein